MAIRSALDPSIRYDDADQEAAQSRARDRDFMMRSWLQNQQMGQQRSMQQEDMGARERMFNAELADRGQGRQYEGGLRMNMLEMGQKPQMAGLAEDRRRWDTMREDGAGAREYSNLQSGFRADTLRGLIERMRGGGQGSMPAGGQPGMPGSASAGGGGFMSPQDDRALLFGIMGQGMPRDVNQENADFIRQIIKAKMANDPNADMADYAGALKNNDLGSIPKPQIAAIDPAQLEQSLAGETSQFANQDNKLIGFDPGEEQVQSIVRKRDDLARAYQAKIRGLTPAQALEKANFTINEQLRPFASNLGMDMVRRLQSALQGTAAPAADPYSGGMNMSEFPG